MVSSSTVLAFAGAALLFAPAETLAALGMSAADPLAAQLMSALYLGAAAANWTARGSMIGGIYARPLALGNYAHFAIGAVILVMGLRRGDPSPAYFGILFLYCVLGTFFTILLFNGPIVYRDRNAAKE